MQTIVIRAVSHCKNMQTGDIIVEKEEGYILLFSERLTTVYMCFPDGLHNGLLAVPRVT